MDKNIEYIFNSFKGIETKINKDSFVILNKEDVFLFILFDGVSSAINAKIGVDESINFIKENYLSFLKDGFFNLKELISKTNKYLIGEGIIEPYTTITAVTLNLKSDKVKFLNLGDSRFYGLSKQYIKQYSKDDKGLISHSLTKCLGMKELKTDDFKEIEIQAPEKRLLLCSDGFYSFLEDQKIEFFDILNFDNLEKTKEVIKNKIIENNYDDATYILINYYV
jgi:serine/threonine protein phosphatase PrpC